MAKIHRLNGTKRSAIVAYKEVLRRCPTSIETIEALVDLGVDAKELIDIVNESKESSEINNQSNDLSGTSWICTIINSLVDARNSEFGKAMKHMRSLHESYPKSSYIFTNLVQYGLEYDEEACSDSLSLYKQIFRRSVNANKSDVVAFAYYLQEESGEVSRLANEILNLCPSRPEGWLIAAMFSDMKKDVETAFSFIDKATKLNPTYANSFKIKGKFHYNQGNFDEAYIAYAQANSICCDLQSYRGMIQANVAQNKLKEAAKTAKMLVTLMPKSSISYMLLGDVVSKSAKGAADSIRAYKKALKLDPSSKAAVLGLSKAYIIEQNYTDAIDILTTMLSQIQCDKLRLQLGKALAGAGQYDEAIENLHLAISLNPKDCSDALQEFERVEGILREENELSLQDCEGDSGHSNYA